MKSSWKTFFQNIFKSCDIFGQQIRLYIRGESQYKSTIGGVSTIILLLSGVFFAIYFSIDMLSKVNPKIILYSTVLNETTFVNNNNLFFAFDVRFFNGTRVENSSKLLFKIMSTYANSSINGLNETLLNNDKCKIKFLDKFDLENSVIQRITSNFTCPTLQNLGLSGDPYHSMELTSIIIRFMINQTELKNYNKSEIEKMFPLNFEMYYQSISFNPDSYENPIIKLMSHGEVYLFLNNLVYLSPVFGNSTLIQDDSLIFTNNKVSSILGFKSVNSFTFPSIVYNNLSVLIETNIFISTFQDIYKRSYLKLQDVGAQTSAMIKILVSIFDLGLFIYTYNRINQQLAFKFFKYEHENMENAKHLFSKKRKTLSEMDLNLNLPKRKDKNLDLLLNGEISLTERKLIPEINSKNSLERENVNENKINDINDQTFNEKTEKKISSNENNKSTIKVIESNLKNSVKNPVKLEINKFNYSKINEMFNLDEILKKNNKLSFRESLKLFLVCCPNSPKLIEKKKFFKKAEEKIIEMLDIESILSKLEEFDNMKILFLNSYQNLSLKFCKKINILNRNLTNLIDYNECFKGNSKRDNIIIVIKYFLEKIKTKKADELDKKLLEMIQPEILSSIFDLLE